MHIDTDFIVYIHNKQSLNIIKKNVLMKIGQSGNDQCTISGQCGKCHII